MKTKNYEVNMEVESNIRRIHENLDLFYLTEKLKQLVNIVNLEEISWIPTWTSHWKKEVIDH